MEKSTIHPDCRQELPLVLLVDDAQGNRKLLMAALAGRYRLAEAEGGEQALQLARAADQPDLILLDLMMPKVDGREVLRQLRADADTCDIPVIVITGDATDRSELECLELGADEFLTKPVKIAALLVRVSNLLRRRQLEKKIIAGEEKYRQLFLSMVQGVLYHDANGAVIDANPAACEILGLSINQLLGKASIDPDWYCVHDDGSDFPGEEHPSMQALRSGEFVKDVVMGVWRPDENRFRWLLINATPLFQPVESLNKDIQPINQRPYQVHTTFTDITDNRTAVIALRQERSFNEVIVENTGGVLLVMDRRGYMVRANRAVERMTGFYRTELLGKPVWDWLIPPEKIAGVKAVFANIQATALPNEYENEWLTRKGGRVMFHWYNSVLLDDAGKVEYVIAQGHDITEENANKLRIQLDQDQGKILREMLELGFAPEALEVIMQRALERLFQVSWLALQSQGGIFLMDGDSGYLKLVVGHAMAPQVLKFCSRVPVGSCVCGRAAASQQMQYASHVDHQHDFSYDNMNDHGHYSLPLIAGKKVLGVLVLYLPIGFQREQYKEEFLAAVANVLSGIIHRKQDEASLLEREQLYRNIVETSTDGFLLMDSQAGILEVNDAYMGFSGYSREDLLGMSITELEVSEGVLAKSVSKNWAGESLEKILREGSGLFESHHRTRDGRIWPVEISVSYLPVHGGRFFAFLRDITQRDQLRQVLLKHRSDLEEQVALRTAELNDSRSQLETIIDTLPAILFIKDINGLYSRVNRRYVSDVGSKHDTVIGLHDRDIFAPEVAEVIIRVDQQVLASGHAMTFEERVPRKDGHLHHYLTTKQPLRDAQGNVTGLLGVAIDITQMKAVQEQLSRAQSIAHLGSWRFDFSNNDLSWSDETYRIFAVPKGKQLNYTDFLARIYPEDRIAVMEAFEAIKQSGTYDIEHRIIIGDQIKWVHGHAGIYCDEAGQPLYAEGTVQDINEIKQAEIALQSALADATRHARVKSEFLANMSHEIRTPLNGILGLAQIGKRENSGRQSYRLFDQLVESGQLLLGIVNDILDFSKIEAGKLNIEMTDVQLDRVVQHVVVMCTDRASVKGLPLTIDVDANLPPWFKGDPLRIAQILVNLIGNAIKFTEQGKVSLSIERDHNQIVFCVRDSGIGMAPEHVARLFQPFEQADGSITRRFGGTGLGLAITQRLVNLMQGEIRVESRFGEGSMFEVRLPLQEVEVPEDAFMPYMPAASATVNTLKPLANLRILAAEDNSVNRMVLEDMIEMEGATLTCVEDGLQALALIQREGDAAWDIVLTDIHMPLMGGHELAQRLRQLAPTLPIVGVTAHALAEERLHCLESGMVAHVAKPIVLQDLVETILRFARRPAVAAVAVAAPTVVSVAVPVVPAESRLAADAPPIENAFIDWDELLAFYKGRQGFVDKLLQKTLAGHLETPAKLRAAALISDFAALQFIAHGFVGVAGALHAHSLVDAARAVEYPAREGLPAAVAEAELLATAIERFLAVVQHKLGG